MRLVVRTPSGEREVSVTAEPGATVADLAAALGAAPDAPVALDGVPAGPGEPLAAYAAGDGSVVHVGCAPVPPAAAAPAVLAEVAVVGGLAAGSRHPLGAGTHPVGRSQLRSPTVSRRHAEVLVSATGSVAVRDTGSRNGTRVDGAWALCPTPVEPGSVLALGAVQAVVRPAAPAPARGRTTHNRPPRPPSPAAPAPLRMPSAAPVRTDKPRFSWAAVLVPLVLGGAMVVLLGSAMYAALTLLSPLMVIANWWEERRRLRRDNTRSGARESSEVAEFAAAVAEAHSAARADLRTASPDLAALVATAEAATPRLWERRPAHDDYLRLSLGLGTLSWQPPLERAGDPAPAASDVLGAHATLTDVPVTVDLRPGNVLGLVGDRAACLGLARGLAAQAAVLHGPADLRIAVLTRDLASWRWAAWLPHTGPDGVAASASASEAGSLPAGALVLVDDPALTQGRPAPVRDLLSSGAVAGIVVADRVEQLPAACTSVVHVDADGAATLDASTPLLVAGLDEPTARRCARALARVDDPEAAAAVAGTDGVTLLPLLHVNRTDVAGSLAERWRASRPTRCGS
jgi:S-DNA-T family DNA segregation ATPase FtsK/SpoIIIE